ncbi:MAG: hypothetical protein KAU20_05340 [Nanoarchaeota archaeon]|nr:hypothetical protein [Nanoarchaeota archaeon]
MNKKDWETQLKEMERLCSVAKDNVEAAQKQVDELEFNISNYKAKIETFK